MPLQPGSTAPEFALYDTERKKTALADYRGKNVLLLFFPLAFTSTCTKELCTVRDSIATYNNVNAEVIAISVDSVHTLKKFKQDQSLNFTLLSDFNKEASRDYDALYEVFSLEMRGVSKRAAFVIDGDGILQYAEVLENAGDIPDFDAIDKSLKILHEQG